MSTKIKYNGKTCIQESELNKLIKDKLEEKVVNTLDDVLDNGSTPKPEEPNLEETVEDPNTTDNGEDIKIQGAIEAIKSALGVTDISDEDSDQLQLILGSILSGANTESPIEPMQELEAPDTILHEGRIFRKIGKMSDLAPMMESSEKPAPAKIKVNEKIFKRI